MNSQMTFSTSSCFSLYHCMMSALWQLLRTWSSVCLSLLSLQQLDRPSLLLHTDRFALYGTGSCTAKVSHATNNGRWVARWRASSLLISNVVVNLIAGSVEASSWQACDTCCFLYSKDFGMRLRPPWE